MAENNLETTPMIKQLVRRRVGPATAANLTAKPLPPLPPVFALRFALWLRKKCLMLADRIVPPHFAIFERSTGLMQSMMLAVVARHGVADLLIEQPMNAEMIAERTRTNADVLHRVLRALATSGIFELDAQGVFRNNRLSLALRSHSSYATREWLQYIGSQSNTLAWSDLEGSVVDGLGSFDRVFGMTVWDWFEKYPDEQDMFAHSMMGLTVLQASTIALLYPFHEIKVLCDVGGGRGTLLSELLIRHSHLKGWLYDAQGVLDSARALLSDRKVANRMKLIAGSFFDSIPAGADAYMLKNIMHDWDDAACLVVLKNVHKAMKPGQRVIVVELLVAKNQASGLGPMADIQMLVACSNGRERSVEELQALLRQAGFVSERVFQHPAIGIVEAVYP